MSEGIVVVLIIINALVLLLGICFAAAGVKDLLSDKEKGRRK